MALGLFNFEIFNCRVELAILSNGSIPNFKVLFNTATVGGIFEQKGHNFERSFALELTISPHLIVCISGINFKKI